MAKWKRNTRLKTSEWPNLRCHRRMSKTIKLMQRGQAYFFGFKWSFSTLGTHSRPCSSRRNAGSAANPIVEASLPARNTHSPVVRLLRSFGLGRKVSNFSGRPPYSLLVDSPRLGWMDAIDHFFRLDWYRPTLLVSASSNTYFHDCGWTSFRLQSRERKSGRI